MHEASDDAERGHGAEERRQRERFVEARERPPMKLPTESARNQTPIISPAMRAGASLVIALRPTGLRQQLAEGVQQIGRRSATSG